MQPNVNVTTTTNVWLASAWVDQVLQDNFFFGEILSRTKKWGGATMNFPRLLKSLVALMGK